jgi:hypothetical protein
MAGGNFPEICNLKPLLVWVLPRHTQQSKKKNNNRLPAAIIPY